MSVLVVVPVITAPRPNIVPSWTSAHHCVVINGDHNLWHDLAADRSWIVVDDHGPTNLGCPASWNRGCDLAAEHGHSHVMIMSQSMMLHHGTASLVDRIPADVDLVTTQHHTFHCVTISVDLWRRAGGFDVTLPIWCDIDFEDRIRPLQPRHVQLNVAATTERAIAVRTGHVSPDVYEADERRYRQRAASP